MQICYNSVSQGICHMFRTLRDHHQVVSFLRYKHSPTHKTATTVV